MEHKKQNSLFVYRKRMGFSQKHVARLLGLRSTSMLARYERGRSIPPLPRALSLGVILRVPVEFLFPTLYDSLRDGIRKQEERLAKPIQQTLFSPKQSTSHHAKHS
jgi:transcriptional regulator with XRE-family HTH domain